MIFPWGLTVFRDQEFSSDLGSRAVNRINNVRTMRGLQFAEDASPMAHPIRPDKVIEMNNFYTLTVYEKGAEIIRMIHTLLGEENFQKGMQLYFERHDGSAATCDDFVQAMEDASNVDLSHFRRWYSQAGTPIVTVKDDYNPETEQYTLTISQRTPPTAEQEEKHPLHIPFSVELYDNEGNVYVGRTEEEVRQENNLGADVALRQDEDVLDTWFSSALWTFSTLGWPENTDALRQFHPTSVMVSGFDIIFFWIARMIMMTMHFIKDENGKPQVPFHTVYMTGLIRDDEGQKMSKSKGNVIDPLDMVDGISLPELLEKRTGNMMQPQLADKIRKRTEKQFPNGIEPHGTDALRFTLAALASTGRDINWDMKRLEGYRNFCNKLWNASRFVLMNTEDQDCGFNGGEMTLSLADRWILAEFNQTIKAYREALDSFRFDIAAGILYEFTWNQFCDWYLELTKPVMNGGTEAELRGTRHTLVTVLEGLLRLAHPIIPFITETIWQRVKAICGITADTIMLQPFPQYDASQVDEAALADTEWLKQAIVAVRNIRAEMNIAPGKPLELLLRGCSADAERRVNENRGFLQTLARLESITVLPADDKGPVSVTKIVDGAELLIPMAGLINKEDELARLAKEVAKIEGEISRIENKLANEGFVARAPEAVIAKEREKLEGYAEAKAKLIEQQAVIAAL